MAFDGITIAAMVQELHKNLITAVLTNCTAGGEALMLQEREQTDSAGYLFPQVLLSR